MRTIYAALVLVLPTAAGAQPATLVQPSPEYVAARSRGDAAAAFDIIRAELAECEADAEAPGNCLEILNQAAASALATGNFATAEELARRAVPIAERAFGERSAGAAVGLDMLGNSLRSLARHDEAEVAHRRALDIRLATLGPNDPRVANSYDALALVAFDRQQLRESEALHRQALAIRIATFGPRHAATATSYGLLATDLLLSGRALEAEPLGRQALETRLEVFGERHPATGTAFRALSLILANQGRSTEAEPLLLKALDIHVATIGEMHPETRLTYDFVAQMFQRQGRLTEAERLRRDTFEARTAALGPRHLLTLFAAQFLAGVLDEMGRYQEAETLWRSVLDGRRAEYGENDGLTLMAYSGLAANLLAQGNSAEADNLYRKIFQAELASLGESDLQIATSYANVAIELLYAGRYAEAEMLMRRSVDITESTLGADDPRTAVGYVRLALILNRRAASPEAEPLFRKALAVHRRVVGEHSVTTANTLHDFATTMSRLGRYREAQETASEALDIYLSEYGERHPSTALASYSVGFYLLKQGEYARAEEMLVKARELQEAIPRTDDIGQPIAGALAELYIAMGRGPDASREARKVVAMARSAGAMKDLDRDSPDERRKAFLTLLQALWLRYSELDADDPEGSALLDETFAAAQDAGLNRTGYAVTQLGARFAAGDSALAAVLRDQQDTINQAQRLERRLVAAWSNSDSPLVQELDQRAQIVADRLAALDATIQQSFPDYAALVAPRALSVGDVQRRLGERQGMVMIVPNEDAVFVFAIARDGSAWHRAALNSTELADAVARLRCGIAGDDCLRVAPGAKARVFDRSIAHRLYVELFDPVSDVFRNVDQLYVVTVGPLSSLPLGVLVTAQPEPAESDADLATLRDTAWLGNRFALVTLPSVASLQSLRNRATTHERGFIGFGDPLLAAVVATDRSAWGIEAFFRGVTAAGTPLADASALSRLPSLPGTRVELETMAAAFGGNNVTLLGADATETAVKRARLSADVAVFATHGLVAGEIRGLAEPGLVFTPPANATADDDGILTASEVAQLDLDVDWLVLSACNTAAADGSPGAEPLSGLARAFLYAGARTLLVSHWPVYDGVTAQLTVQTLAQARTKPRAAALQAAMIAIRTGVDADGTPVPGWHPSWSHPAAWAPFVLVSSE